MTFLGALLLLALVAAGLAQAGPYWAETVQREREAELIRIGTLYARAIGRYRDMSPGSLKTYPAELERLLDDGRFVGTVRHLRKIYTDPLQPGQRFAVIRGEDGTIRGVRSTSTAAPLRKAPVDIDGVHLPVATHYSDWLFSPPPPRP